jgi:beta-lactam-binding protein with PASTA domain
MAVWSVVALARPFVQAGAVVRSLRRFGVAAVSVAVSCGLLPAPKAMAAATCGAPHQAPGFEVPARRNVVPDTTCMDLQLAQDKVEAAGLHPGRSQDATGRHRNQFNDRDWVVVDQAPKPGSRVRPGTQVTFSVLAYGDPGAPPPPDRAAPGPLPHLACFDLQEAEDTLQSVGFTDVAAEDASSRGRRPLYDRNWTVTAQRPAPGGRWPKTTRVTLVAAKDSEVRSCG